MTSLPSMSLPASLLVCPVCSNTLEQSDKRWQCRNNHSFDEARQGYLNLLLAQHKNSKAPGDDLAMADARARLLDSGVYEPVSNLLNSNVQGLPQRILDIGCGEGYYTARLKQHLANQGCAAQIVGLDISKDTIRRAVRRDRDIQWIVASGARPPVANHSIDLVMSLFTPLMPQGLEGIIHSDTDIILVNTGPQHLIELRHIIYDEVRLDTFSPITKMAEAGFECVGEDTVQQTIHLTSSQHIGDLLMMTPHHWRVTQTARERLLAHTELDVSIDVVLHRFRLSKHKIAIAGTESK